MRPSVVTAYNFLDILHVSVIILLLSISEAIPCQEFTKEREMKRLRTCLSTWSFYRSNKNPKVEDLFQENMKNEICQIGSRRKVRFCITHIAGRCTHLLIYWRHVYDPISHICDMEHDFNQSKDCRTHPVFTTMFQICEEELQQRIQEKDNNCWKFKWHKDCLMSFVQSVDECRSANTTSLIDRVLFYHYRHMAAYQHCTYENNRTLPDTSIILAANKQTVFNQTKPDQSARL